MYRREEGMWARVPMAIIGGLITVVLTKMASEWGRGILTYIWAALVCAALAGVTLYFSFFHRKTGDVLIDTESEMRKVVWPNAEEVKGSTIVVIATTVLLGLTIYVMDRLLIGALILTRLY